MKTDISARKSHAPSTNLVWHTWTERCDACGKQIKQSGEWETTSTPNYIEEDFCIDCLNFALDNNIPKDQLIHAIKIKKQMFG